jgi:hypothetical protein
LILEDNYQQNDILASYGYDGGEYYWFFNGDLTPETDGITIYVQWEDAEKVYRAGMTLAPAANPFPLPRI